MRITDSRGREKSDLFSEVSNTHAWNFLVTLKKLINRFRLTESNMKLSQQEGGAPDYYTGAEITEIQIKLYSRWCRQQGAFPLPFKLRKLKLRIEIRLMETSQFRKNSHISQKSFYEVVFQAIRKGIIRKIALEKVFFAFTGHMAYVKSHIIILQCTITFKNDFIRASSRI